MGGPLWGGLALVCVCVLGTVTGDTDRRTPWDEGQPARPGPPRAPQVKAKSGEEGPPVEERGHRRVRRDGEGTTGTNNSTNTTAATNVNVNTTAPVTNTTATPNNTTNTTIPINTTMTTTIPTTTTTTTTTIPTTTTTTTTRPTTTNAGQCQNGATWNGIKCECPDGFYGVYCETSVCQNGGSWVNGVCQCPPNFQGVECQFYKETVEVQEEVTVNATVEMKAKVDNRNFTEDLADRSSQAFQAFEKEFKEQMREVYKNIEGYQDVVIHELSRGSVVVNYTVILKVLATASSTEAVENISKNLVSALDSYTGCNESCQGDNCSLCFNPTFTNVTNYEVPEVETSVCAPYVPPDFRPYYFPLVTAAGVVCVTRCDRRSADPHLCVHGTCSVTRSGPQCQCSDEVAFWYRDELCSSRISKMGVAVGVPAAALVVAVATFTIVTVRMRRQRDKDRPKRRPGDRPVLSPVAVPPRNHQGAFGSHLYCDVGEKGDDKWGFAISNPGASWGDAKTPRANTTLEKVNTSQEIHIQRPTHIVPP